MFTFFSKNYTALRNDKIKLYRVVGVYHYNTKEHLPNHWPICNFPHFHSFAEFALQFAGIFLKPLLCFGSMVFSIIQAAFNLIESILTLVFLWRPDLSARAFSISLYEASNAIYMMMSMIVDPVLALISFAVRSFTTILYGFSLIFSDGETVEPTTPKIGSLGQSSLLKFNENSLNHVSLYNDILDAGDEWHNSPML